MLKKLTLLPIKKRNLIGFFSLILLLIMISIVSLVSLNILSNNTKALYHKSFAINHNSWTIQNGFNTLEKEMYKVIVSNSSSSILQTTADIFNAIENLRRLVNNDPEYNSRLDLLQENLKSLKTVHQKILEESLGGNQESALSLLHNDYAKTVTSAHTTAKSLTTYAQQSAEDFLSNSIALKNNVFIWVIILMLSSIVLGIRISFYITHSIIGPLDAFKEGLTAFSNGELSIHIPYEQTDEIGELGYCLNHSTMILKQYIENISDTLALLASGHMDIAINIPYKGDFETIKTSILHIAESLGHVFSQISSATHEVSENALQVLHGSQTLTQKNIHQKQLIDNLVDSIQLVSNKVTENALTAHEIHEMSLNLTSFIEEGNKHTVSMTLAMNAIENASTDIQKIVDVIDAIASKSHLLALNASIEAARFGDAGRGFSVIAHEMQELSAKSSAAVKETTELIKICLDTSASGTKTILKTADFLSHMAYEVKKTHEPIAAITYSSNEQASTLSDMVKDVSGISNITHETSAFAMESADIAEILVAQSQELKAQLSQFTLESNNA